MRRIMRPSICLFFAVTWLIPGLAMAVTMGLPVLTPGTSIQPLHSFRVDLGLLSVQGIHSLRSQRRGNLWGPYLAITYGAASNAELIAEGMLYKSFSPDRGKGSSAVGDFAIWGKFLLGEPSGDLKYGVRFGAKLPNTPSNKDFGTNQTDFFMHVFVGRTYGNWDFSACVGLGILERPGGEESQDDVAMFGVMGIRKLGRALLRVEAQGFTKSRIYGDNWALAGNFEWPLSKSIGVLGGGQVSKGRLYGSSEVRLGLVARL